MSAAAPDATRAAIQQALDAAHKALAFRKMLPCSDGTIGQALAREEWIDIMRRRVAILEAQLHAWDKGATST